jgi:Homeodomain-like domain
VLVQPATVDRWRRDGFGRCWRRRSGRAGRPRIDSPSRDLIRRLAAENHLWGAPRIHGELLKLGIAVSERTVSRYLQGRPKARSQTWRTFFANHLSDRAFMRPVASSVATDDDVVVDASACRSARCRCRSIICAQPISWGLSIGPGRVDPPFLARVSPKITFTTDQARETAPDGTRRGSCG